MSKHRNSFHTLIIGLAAFLTLVIVAALAFFGGLALSPHLYSVAQAAEGEAAIELASTGEGEPAQQGENILAELEATFIDIYQRALPSVVDIEVTQRVTSGTVSRFGQQSEDLFRRGEGSGFVWDKEGHIVTNYHVVEEAASVKVIFADGVSTTAEVIGVDPDADLAVLRVDLHVLQLQPLTLGDSDELKVGQLTFAIGNPYGQDFTMTSGIVSAVGRTILGGNSTFSIPEVIQTDAAINPGNSGGPLLNREGKVIGINTMIISESGSNAGVGFAIPINIAKQVIPTLIAEGDYEYARLGISGTTLTDEVAEAMSLPAGTQGALIISVAQGGPADQAGLRDSPDVLTISGQEVPYGGDVIIAIQGEPITGMDALITYLVENTRPGDQVTLGLIRSGGERENVSVTLDVRPEN